MFESKKLKRFVGENRVQPAQERLLGLGAAIIAAADFTPLVLALRTPREQLAAHLQQTWNVVDAHTARDAIVWLVDAGARETYADKYRAFQAGQSAPLNDSYGQLLTAAQRFGFAEQDLRGCPTLAAWDYDRAAALTRQSFALGYLDEAEVWEILGALVPEVHTEFNDWRSYALSLAVGRSFCFGGDPAEILTTLRRLLEKDPELSPWVLHPLNTL
ncbi:hypothetical protein GCM10022198_11540 [Klugiella xanthotipulae]|uniref:Uncharacterized protein DUF1266 n=1 Tax=Klugiella xanthotipulae TaxID=244735 RepID=A0A543HYX6_9MICO|nr:DUF1266 domain-containing protein [Klugiella xanthotipulae]TQM63544.1 uncharacterized protein DUF1266 [Klugiella xanthotipulae]